MKDRLLKFLNKEELSSARFAETIGVQPSSVSHILSGRNKPGFDFITKILTSYPALNADWLIMGKGSMFKSDQGQRDLFSDNYNRETGTGSLVTGKNIQGSPENESDASDEREDTGILDTFVKKDQSSGDYKGEFNKISEVTDVIRNRKIEKIMVLYSDQTFSEYTPAR
jgi:transcriptional regulator with XRE-family HTH domain